MSQTMNPPPIPRQEYARSTQRPRRAIAVGSRPMRYAVAKVGRLIRVAVAGLTTLALAIGILLCLVLWRAKSDTSDGPGSREIIPTDSLT